MKYFFVLVISAILFTHCASTETVSNNEESSESIEEPEKQFAPEWFDPNVESKSDSLSFSGYSHSVADNEDRAREQAERIAISNLRFEIDRYTENVRRELEEEEGTNPFGTPEFIMNLRNAIQELSLSDVNFNSEVKEKDGIPHFFIHAELSRSAVVDKLSAEMSNTSFIEALN